MQLDKFMWLYIVPRHLTIFFKNLTSGEAEQSVCVRRNLRVLVLFLLAVGTKGGGLGSDIRGLVPFIIIFARTQIATRFTIRQHIRRCKRYRRWRSPIPSNILEPWVEW